MMNPGSPREEQRSAGGRPKFVNILGALLDEIAASPQLAAAFIDTAVRSNGADLRAGCSYRNLGSGFHCELWATHAFNVYLLKDPGALQLRNAGVSRCAPPL